MSNADQPPSWINSPWLDEYDGATSVRSARHPPFDQIDAAPLEAYLQGVLAAENAAIRHIGALSRLYGPHASTWGYRASIESEVRRLSSACRESVGVERESNLRQLREAEAARSEFCETPEFRAAVAYALAVVDRAIESAGTDLTPEQIAAKARYAAIRASLEALIAAPEGTTESHKEPDSKEALQGSEPLSSSAMTVMKLSAVKERLARKYPKLENDFKRGEPWTKGCAVPGRHGYYFVELIEKACIAKWGGFLEGERPPLDCFSMGSQVARANGR